MANTAAESPFLIHPSYFLREGLRWANVDEERQAKRSKSTNIRVFKSFYGKHPLHLARVWRDLQVFGVMGVEEAKTKESFAGFMLANNFLRLYEVDDVRNARFDINHLDLLQLTWEFVGKIASLKKDKIKCPTVWPVKLGASVDGTQVRTNEPRDKDMRRNPKNFAYKYNFAGLNYQIVLSLFTNECWYVNSGDPGSVHDITAIRREFVDMVPDGCRVIADSGFTGKSDKEKRIFSVRNNLDSDEVADFKKRAKSRQETFNKRMKDYDVLKKSFRHGIKRHCLCFDAVAVLVQYAIEDTSSVGEPLDTL